MHWISNVVRRKILGVTHLTLRVYCNGLRKTGGRVTHCKRQRCREIFDLFFGNLVIRYIKSGFSGVYEIHLNRIFQTHHQNARTNVVCENCQFSLF